MLTSLLVATDLSDRSARAVARAAALATAAQARLTALHVVENDAPEDRLRETIRSAERDVADQLAAVGAPGDCEIVVTPGHAFHVIGEAARARGVDVIVTGAHRRRFLRDVFVGTTVERVTRTAGRPVLMANGVSGGPWRRVLVATDMSETSGRAACAAHALGLFDGAEVTFVHGYAPITRQLMAYAGVLPERIHEEAEREFQATCADLGRFIQGLGLGDLPRHARIIEGVGADAIAGFVGQHRPDLLVIGTRGLSGVKRLFLGSVAQDLMGSLEIDIFAAPPLL
ncbi:MAG: universal stress protein [Rhodobacteraceae bacterium]|nr:MAG: universal stress protein [Paracoccaceae bacterium]